MTLRRTIFWIHLGVGVSAAVVVLMMSVTGVVLTYEMQLNEWGRRGYRTMSAEPGAKPLAADILLERAATASSEGAPSSLALGADPLAPAVVGFGRRQTLYVDRYTGEIRGDGDTRMRRFLRSVMYWHRWFAVSDDNRAIGRAVTGAANLGFLFLVVSGFYLWWPRTWTRRLLRNVTWFRRGLGPKARDFNWHNVIGFWLAVPLLIIVFSGAMISYRWVGNLIHFAVGETPPSRGTPSATVRRSLGGCDGAGLDRIGPDLEAVLRSKSARAGCAANRGLARGPASGDGGGSLGTGARERARGAGAGVEGGLTHVRTARRPGNAHTSRYGHPTQQQETLETQGY